METSISRAQRELWAAQTAYSNALATNDRQIIGRAADNLNREYKKYISETGLAKMTDLELVESFNNLRAVAAHNRQHGGDYLTYTRKAMKLVPEMNRRGLTESYFPTHDDLTYTLVTDSERYKYLANKFGSQALKDAADNNISAYDYNISLASKYRDLADANFGGYINPMSIGNRTYDVSDLSTYSMTAKKPSRTPSISGSIETMKNVEDAIVKGAVDLRTFMESDVYKNSVFHDIALAKRSFGYDIKPVKSGVYAQMEPFDIKIGRLGDDNLGVTAIKSTNNPLEDVITIDVGGHKTPEALQNTSFHEYGHHGRYKVVDPIHHITNGNPSGAVDPTTQFYK